MALLDYIQPGWLQADILINTDSEEEGEIYMGCAGGIDVKTTVDLTLKKLFLQTISSKNWY